MNELAISAIMSLPKVLLYKIKYMKRLKMGYVQALGGHTLIAIRRGAKATIGYETVSRFALTVRVDSGELSIGDKCFFNSNVSITCMEKITIGDGCQFANNVVIVDHDHDYRRGWGYYKSSPVTIGNNVWIGANVVILRGAVIEDNAVVAAGSVVKGTVLEGTVYRGYPE